MPTSDELSNSQKIIETKNIINFLKKCKKLRWKLVIDSENFCIDWKLEWKWIKNNMFYLTNKKYNTHPNKIIIHREYTKLFLIFEC